MAPIEGARRVCPSTESEGESGRIAAFERIGYPLDPRTLMVLLIVGSIVPFVAGRLAVWVLLIVSSLVYYLFKKSLPLTWLVMAVSLQGIVAAINASGLFGAVLAFGILIWAIASLIPTFIIGAVLVSIPSGAIMQALRTLRIPETGLIGIAVALRYLPDVRMQLIQISKAAKVRGFRLSPLHPVRSFELLIVPLIHRSLRASDDLTAAIISKGIEFEAAKTSLYLFRPGALDVIVLTVYLLLFLSRFTFGS